MQRSPQPHRPPSEPTEDDIQKCAYYLWQEEGRPSERDLEFWLSAKELVRRLVPERPPRPGPRRRVTN